jgi:3-hydroxy acid dehydrogenase/malonic semialdehyde reductase
MKTILITGASSGFGEAAARLLAEHEFKLILTARREDKLEKLKKELKVPVHIAKLDVTDKKAIDKFLKELPNDFKEIDVLINNAGLARGTEPAFEADLDGWDEMVDTNIKGLMYMTRKILPLMKDRNVGQIINIGSVAGHAAYKGGNVYGSTKAFVNQFTKNLRADLIGTDIRVSNIEPGMAETEFSIVRFKGDAEKAKKVYEGTRALKAEDIADTILWIIQRPAHVNIDNIEIMPIDQSWGGLAIYRK